MKLITGILCIGISGVITAQINLNASLTACYALNGNAMEPIHGLTGTLNSVTSAANRFNQSNSALYFNGSTTSYVELPNSPYLKPADKFSFSAWIKPVINNFSDQEVLFTKNTLSSNFTAYALTIQSGMNGMVFRGYKQDAIGSETLDGTTVVNTNTWYHVVMEVSNDSMRIFVNGNLEASRAVTISYNYDPNSYVILGGTNEPAGNPPFNGTLDNIRFYNRFLNNAEVNALYTSDPTCIETVTTSISENRKERLFTVYPNPTTANLFIEKGELDINTITISDVTGKVVYVSNDKTGTKSAIDLGALQPGIYFVEIKAGSFVERQRLIKE